MTIVAEETRAVLDVFGLNKDTEEGGQPFYTGAAGSTAIVATRTLQQGQRSVIPALEGLRRRYAPAVMVLLGIGGAIHSDVAVDDVVVATRVVYYDLRKVTSEGVQPRGEERHAPARMSHAVNSFFTAFGDPAQFVGDGIRFRAFSGPIGSGDAVVADGDHQIRKYLRDFNDKILALDMEAGGFSQYCHETSDASGNALNWLVVRGVSDAADATKDDSRRESAALNAAYTFRELIPYLHANL